MGILMPASINQELKILYLIQLVGPPLVLEDSFHTTDRFCIFNVDNRLEKMYNSPNS